jgi:LysR family nitrogen assimilation transcriptional regulator
MRLLLPSRAHFLRQIIDGGFARVGLQPHIVAEVDSLSALRDALRANLGCVILPNSAIVEGPGRNGLQIRPIRSPRLEATVALCMPEQLPITDSVRVVEDIVIQLTSEALADNWWNGVRPLASGMKAG